MKSLFPYIYDFLSLLLEDEKVRKKIKRVILFGSVARGDADEESDIDIFIDIQSEAHEKDVQGYLKEVEKRFYLLSERKWSLIGIRQPIKCIVGVLDDDKWKDLRLEIGDYGMVLFGGYEEPEGVMKQYVIFSYSLSRLSQKKKMALLRRLFGYRLKRGKKVYENPGLLKEIGGEKLGRNAIMVPSGHSRKVGDFFASYGITPLVRSARTK
jgi:predicted nucleotidyltransferase